MERPLEESRFQAKLKSGSSRVLVAVHDKTFEGGLMKKRDSKKIHRVLSSWVAFTMRGEVHSNENN